VQWGARRVMAQARSRAGVAAALGLGGGRAGARGVEAGRQLGVGKERGRDAPGPRT
jgi:hypothetical protein